jgi:SAM-dependent methyltransferase
LGAGLCVRRIDVTTAGMPVSDKLEFTGERFTPECVREIRYEHYHRYAFAAGFCAGLSVLDAACGEGYGSAILAGSAASVVGVDLSDDAITHANRRYSERSNLEFRQADVTCLPFEDDAFDRIVSFETLEHLQPQEALLAEFRRVLRPDGLLLLSSPDKAVYTDELGNENAFHVRELYRDELDQLIASEFPASRVLGQKLMFHSVIWGEATPRRCDIQTLTDDGRVEEGPLRSAPVYFIVLCAGREELLPEIDGRMWLFKDEEESVYRHYYHEIRKNMAAGKLLLEKDAEIEQLKQRLADADRPGRRRWFRRG